MSHFNSILTFYYNKLMLRLTLKTVEKLQQLMRATLMNA